MITVLKLPTDCTCNFLLYCLKNSKEIKELDLLLHLIFLTLVNGG